MPVLSGQLQELSELGDPEKFAPIFRNLILPQSPHSDLPGQKNSEHTWIRSRIQPNHIPVCRQGILPLGAGFQFHEDCQSDYYFDPEVSQVLGQPNQQVIHKDN
jgi:hypothetical protein